MNRLVRFSVLALLLLVCVGGASAEKGVDGFEHQNVTKYFDYVEDVSPIDTSVSSSQAWKGSYSLLFDITDTSNLEYEKLQSVKSSGSIADGETVQFYLYVEGTPNFGAYEGRFGVSNAQGESGKYTFLRFEEDGLELQDSASGSDGTVYSLQGDTWYKATFTLDKINDEVDVSVDEASTGSNIFTATSTTSPDTFDRSWITVQNRNDEKIFMDEVTAFGTFNQFPEFNSSSISPDPPLIGENVSYSAEVYDSDGSIDRTNLDVEWKGSQVYNANRTGTTTPSWNDVYTPGGEGWLNATLTTYDDAGASTTTSIDRYLSDSAPEFAINDPTNTTYTTPSIPYEINFQNDNDSNANETGYCEVYNDGSLVDNQSASEPSTFSGTVSDVSPGSHTFQTTCYESDDGQSTTKSVQYSNENGPPSIDSFTASPATDWQKGELISFSFDITDGFDNITYVNLTAERDGIQIANRETVYDQESVNDTVSDFFDVSQIGNYTVELTAQDEQNQVSTEWINQSVPDEYPPTTTTNLTTNTFYKTPVYVELNASDEESMIANLTYNVDSAGYQTVNDSSVTVEISGFGDHTLDFYAWDTAGNKEDVNTEIISLEELEANFFYNPSKPFTGETVTFDGGTAQGNIIQYEWDFQSDGTYDATGEVVTNIYNDPGVKDVTLRITDDDGNTDTITQSLEVLFQSENKTLVQSCPATPFCRTNGSNPVQLSGLTAEDGNHSFVYEVNATGADGKYDFFSFYNSTSSRLQFTEYSSILNVTIASNETNIPPTADFSVSLSQLTVDTDASASNDQDGTITDYRWDWTSDGTYEDTGLTASHTYPSKGDYTITLQVEDNNGSTDKLVKTVSVTESSGGDDGGGGTPGGGNDNETDNPEVSVDGSSLRILAPHRAARYGYNFQLDEGGSKTITIRTDEHTIEVLNVEGSRQAEILVDGIQKEVVEREASDVSSASDQPYMVVGNVFVSDIVNSTESKTMYFSSGADTDSIQADIPFGYEYQINQSGTITLQYRETGFNETWVNATQVSFTNTTQKNYTTYYQSLEAGVYEVRGILESNGNTSTTTRTGVYVGDVPFLNITQPPNGKVFKGLPPNGAGGYTIPLEFRAATLNKTKFGPYYTDGQKVYDGATNVNIQDDSGLLETFIERLNNLDYIADFFSYEWQNVDIIAPSDVVFTGSADIAVPSTGGYTGYVNATSNYSEVFTQWNATSIGVEVTVNPTRVRNISDSEVVDIFDPENDEIALPAGGDENFSTGVGSKTFSYPQWRLVDPGNDEKITMLDLANSDVEFSMLMGYEGDAAVNKTLVIRDPNGETINYSLNPSTSVYDDVAVNESVWSNNQWETGMYDWWLNYEVNGSVIYSTENETNGLTSFEVKRAGFADLLSRLIDPLVEGFSKVYDVTNDYAGFIIAVVATIGWYVATKVRGMDFLARAGAIVIVAISWWYGLIPANIQAILLGITALVVILKLMKGDITL